MRVGTVSRASVSGGDGAPDLVEPVSGHRTQVAQYLMMCEACRERSDR
jgi:hypothetical protein